MLKRGVAIATALAGAAGLAWAANERIAFPASYADTFTNYLSLDRVQNDDQIIRLFANKTATDAAASGAALPDGSILVGEIYAAQKDKEGNVVTSSLGRRIRDKLVAIAVMEKRSGWGAAFSDDLKNGDWDFAIFGPSGQRLDKDLNACRQCHAPLKGSDHVFSLEHLNK